VAINTGVDENDDGELQEDEVASVSFVCNADVVTRNDDATIRNQEDLAALEGITTLGGDLRIIGSSLGALDLSALETITGDVEISTNSALISVDLSGLTRIGGGLDIDENDTLTDLNMTSLSSVGGHAYIGDNPSLEAVNISSMSGVNDSLIISTASGASFNASPDLDFVGGDLYIGENDGVESIALRDLFVAGDLTLNENQSLSAVGASGGLFIGNDLIITNNNALPNGPIIALIGLCDPNTDGPACACEDPNDVNSCQLRDSGTEIVGNFRFERGLN
jgi:hypothetical protein